MFIETEEISPEEDVPDTAFDLEREELEQRALQETLEALAEELAERVVLERTEVHRLRLEVARSREDNKERWVHNRHKSFIILSVINA